MKKAQTSKLVKITPPAAIANNTSPATSSVDTKGFRYARIVLFLGATDIALTALKVQEADDDSTYSDITGTVMGTDNNTGGSASTLPSATDDNKFFVFEIDLRGRKRYLDLVMTGGDGAAGTYATALAILSRAKVVPDSVTEKGLAAEVNV